MVTIVNCRQPRAWPRMRMSVAQEPEFDAKKSAQHVVDLTGLLHATASSIRSEYISALAMYCAGKPDFAKGYLNRAAYVYQTYGTEENYNRVAPHTPEVATYNRGISVTYYAFVKLALHGEWDINFLREGLQDMHAYLMEQTYDESCAYKHEDEDRLFTILCQMAIDDYGKAADWLDGYIKHRKLKKIKENFPELLAGIQAQLKMGRNEIAPDLKTYFDQNRLGTYQFRESQSFWICVPIAVLIERISSGRQNDLTWEHVLEQLLY